ncbi:hypothetical protein V7S43_011515 [Phytophthora oleae]|uniref:Uncharacterized protein n=1 Tax=Phytophthora oleae TaxID=2107226 RepID=A0ABD3FBG4_9STRA
MECVPKYHHAGANPQRFLMSPANDVDICGNVHIDCCQEQEITIIKRRGRPKLSNSKNRAYYWAGRIRVNVPWVTRPATFLVVLLVRKANTERTATLFNVATANAKRVR